MFGIENPFSFNPLTREERHRKSEFEKTQKEIDIAAQSALRTAQDCLNSDLFAKYKAEYVEAERGLVEIGIQLNLADPIAYAIAAHTIFTNLKLLKMLGDSVTKDAKNA